MRWLNHSGQCKRIRSYHHDILLADRQCLLKLEACLHLCRAFREEWARKGDCFRILWLFQKLFVDSGFLSKDSQCHWPDYSQEDYLHSQWIIARKIYHFRKHSSPIVKSLASWILDEEWLRLYVTILFHSLMNRALIEFSRLFHFRLDIQGWIFLIKEG